ncbi:MAG: hypothetical protein KKD44_02630 [Proteobacteria bacterium]|nr:hypothetical protein [Pseudomonadota bacterium]
MINNLLNVLINILPIIVEKVSWDGDTLIIAGDGWSFSTLSAWRVINRGTIQFACWDKNINESVNELSGLSIVSVAAQGLNIGVDPVFELSDGRLLEVFSTDTVEPWTLRLPDGKVYVGGS